MALSTMTLKGIDPNLIMDGATQRFIYGTLDPAIKFQQYSQFVPTSLVPSVISIESRNSLLSGFRLKHTTTYTDTNSFGSFKFQSFVADSSGTDIWGFDGTNFNFYNNVYFPASANARRIVLWDTGNGTTDFQFSGIGTSATTDSLYQVPQNKAHIFYEGAGTGVASNTELGRVSASYNNFAGTTYTNQSFGYLSWVSNSTTTPITANVATKALGTTTLSSVSRCATMPANNRLMFTPSDGGTHTISVIATACVTLTWAAAGTPLIAVSIRKNGVQLTPVSSITGIASANFYNVTVNVPTTLTNSDYLEIYLVADATNATGLNITNGSLSFKAV